MISFAGHLKLRAAPRQHGRTVLIEQSFRAPFHLSRPYWDADANTLMVQVVNPTAGILSGDRLDLDIRADEGSALLVTTPSASRVFTMHDGTATCRQRFAVGSGAWLEVSPEPLVPHVRSRYHQTTEVELQPGAGLFFVDQLLPGRIGSGEAWAWTELCLELDVRLGGERIVRERFAPPAAQLKDAATFYGAGATACFANIVIFAGTAVRDTWLPEIHALHHDGVWVGVTPLRNAGWSIKVVAQSTLQLRSTLKAIRGILAPHLPHLRCDTRKL